MCICINCLYVHECSTYKFIKSQHSVNFQEYETKFDPIKPIVYANFVRQTKKSHIDWDVTECLSFLEKPGSWKKSIKKISW
uniref:Ycf34 n=1 Tax=Dermonema virens TaxID=1077399 RepID=A0A1G4NRY0_9FLOR|nr:Hypothetical protein ycf34 [Dermonema virens]SCW21316.1 Hypothetical protein ycf34 [Dermonema virens]